MFFYLYCAWKNTEYISDSLIIIPQEKTIVNTFLKKFNLLLNDLRISPDSSCFLSFSHVSISFLQFVFRPLIIGKTKTQEVEQCSG